jgi:nitrile hydratase beta subunit
MNTIHDLGGMDGFTLPERDQGPALKEDWERALWGLAWSQAIPGYSGGLRVDLERIPPDLYLTLPYYAKWLYGEEQALLRSGLATAEELENPDGPLTMPDFPNFTPPGPAETIQGLASDNSDERKATVAPRFSPGDEVLVKNQHPSGHTRVPRYARGHQGVIQAHHGVHRYLDDVVGNEDPNQQHLYTVTFTGSELWGDRGNPNDRISAELWDFHLEPASQS